MPATIGEAFVAIRPDTDGFAGQVESGVKPGLARLGGLIAGTFAAAKVKDFFSESFGEAQEAQKVGAQTTSVIKSQGNAANITAAQVANLAQSLSRKAGIDDEVIQSGENMLLTFGRVRNEAGKGNDIFNQATKATLDMAVAFSKANGGEIDLQGASIQLGKALNDPIEGVTALQRVGVRLTEQQKDQVKAFVESGDTLSAQKVILAEVTREFGGSAEAQATAADKAAVAWGNLQEAIGLAITPLVNFVANQAMPIVQWLTDHKTAAAALAAVMGGVLVAAIAAYTVNMIAAAAATIAATWPVLAVIAALAALVAAVYFLWTNWDQVWGWIKDHPAIAALVVVLAAPVAAIVSLVGIVHWLYDNWDAVWSGIRSVTASVVGVVLGLWHGLENDLGTLADIAMFFKGIWDSVWGGVAGAVQGAAGVIGGVVGGIVGAVNGVISVLQTLKSVYDSIFASGAVDPSRVNPAYSEFAPYPLKRAAGGGVSAGSPYWVGEEGPELFFPSRSGVIAPHGASMAMAGAGAGSPGGLFAGATVQFYDNPIPQLDYYAITRAGN